MKHSERVKRENERLSPEQVRANKCSRSKQRNAERRQERRQKAEESVSKWRQLTPQEQLEALDRRLGVGVGAKKQRARLKQQELPLSKDGC